MSMYNVNTMNRNNVSLDSFAQLSVIGKGSYAKVMLVRKKGNPKMFAMKILKKKHI
jgi:serine/threonine protein kinase